MVRPCCLQVFELAYSHGNEDRDRSALDKEEVDKIFDAMDQDGTGAINWLEFLAATTHATNLRLAAMAPL